MVNAFPLDEGLQLLIEVPNLAFSSFGGQSLGLHIQQTDLDFKGR